MPDGISGNADGEDADQVVVCGNLQQIGDLAPDGVFVGDVTFHPAALIPQTDSSQQHVFDGCGIVLHIEAPVPIGNDRLCQHTDISRSSRELGRPE